MFDIFISGFVLILSLEEQLVDGRFLLVSEEVGETVTGDDFVLDRFLDMDELLFCLSGLLVGQLTR
jgi:hypothetical protein